MSQSMSVADDAPEPLRCPPWCVAIDAHSGHFSDDQTIELAATIDDEHEYLTMYVNADDAGRFTVALSRSGEIALLLTPDESDAVAEILKQTARDARAALPTP